MSQVRQTRSRVKVTPVGGLVATLTQPQETTTGISSHDINKTNQNTLQGQSADDPKMDVHLVSATAHIPESSGASGAPKSKKTKQTKNSKPPRPAATTHSGSRTQSLPVPPLVGDIEDMSKKRKWMPVDWEKVLDFIRTMRADRRAPVDTMGCERTMEENVEPKVRRYQALVSLMLSSQTKDEVTFAAMGRLKGHGLTVQNILDMDQDDLGKMLTPVGFWKKKADYIKRATQILRNDYDDDIPETIEGLCGLPGVGPKMGYICLAVAWGKHSGIGVDTHVHRISNRLGWVGPKETKTPEQTRVALEAWLPEELWPEFNILLVGFGQIKCTPLHPKCSTCLANQLCPFGAKELKGTKVKP